MKLPEGTYWRQPNTSDSLGELVGSFNIDQSTNIGKVRSTRMLQTTSQAGTFGATTNANLTDVPVGFRYFNDGSNTKIWTVAGLKVHASSSAVPSSPFSVDATTGTPAACDSTLSDIEVFNNGATVYLCVAANQKIYYRSTGNWSNSNLAASGPWSLASFNSKLYIAEAGTNIIESTSDLSSFSTILSLDPVHRSTFIRAAYNQLWIGVLNISGGKGYVYSYNGLSTNVTTPYRLEAAGALACVIKDNIPWIVDSNGKLMVLSGNAFKEVARLPINNKLLVRALNSVNNRFIHPNGMSIVNGRINILINNEVHDSGATINEYCPSGVWEYDENIGLYHKSSPSYTATGGNTVYDYGQNRVSAVGGLAELKLTTTASNANGTFLAGATLYTNSSSTDVGVFTDETVTSLTASTVSTQRGSYLVTSKLQASNITDAWKMITPVIKPFLDSTDRLYVKYRTLDIEPTEVTITWASTTTFTTTTSLLGKEGYEVEFIQAVGSGFCAHITRVDWNGTVYTVTIDTAFTNATSTGKARIQNWSKIGLIDAQNIDLKSFGINKIKPWIQFKIFFLFKGKDELSSIIIDNTPNQ